LIFWVAIVWKKIYEFYKRTIIKTFRKVGLSLNPDSSENHIIKIKGLLDIQVSDFDKKTPEYENSLGNLTKTDIIAIETAQIKYTQKIAKRYAKYIKKIAKNLARVKTSKTFPEYIN
jgi:hypothetical protein